LTLDIHEFPRLFLPSLIGTLSIFLQAVRPAGMADSIILENFYKYMPRGNFSGVFVMGKDSTKFALQSVVFTHGLLSGFRTRNIQ